MSYDSYLLLYLVVLIGLVVYFITQLKKVHATKEKSKGFMTLMVIAIVIALFGVMTSGYMSAMELFGEMSR